MDAKQNLYEMQLEIVEVFKAQNPDIGFFDVVFEVDQMKLYAHKYYLTAISQTFKSMLSDRWSSKNQPIKIKDYKYENFKEFLTFIYSGECNIDDENIFTIVDMAETYGVQVLKTTCECYLLSMEPNLQNIFQLLELADKYPLNQLKVLLNAFVSKNFTSMAKDERFKDLSKSVMNNIIEANINTELSENLFEEAFNWAENKAKNKAAAYSNDDDSFIKEATKRKLIDILPLINFQRMNFKFLQQFVVKKSFLFSDDEFSDLLTNAWKRTYVKVIDDNGKIMKGFLNCPDTDVAFKVIQSLKDSKSDGYWPIDQKKPAEPSKITVNQSIEWYLVYDSDGDLAVKSLNNFDNNDDYILAELFAEEGFEKPYRIEVYRCICNF